MRIDIQTPESDEAQVRNSEAYIRNKLPKLERFYDNIIDTIVYLHTEGPKKKVEMKVNVREDMLFCKELGETYEEAADKALDVMARQLKKYKEKHAS